MIEQRRKIIQPYLLQTVSHIQPIDKIFCAIILSINLSKFCSFFFLRSRAFSVEAFFLKWWNLLFPPSIPSIPSICSIPLRARFIADALSNVYLCIKLCMNIAMLLLIGLLLRATHSAQIHTTFSLIFLWQWFSVIPSHSHSHICSHTFGLRHSLLARVYGRLHVRVHIA